MCVARLANEPLRSLAVFDSVALSSVPRISVLSLSLHTHSQPNGIEATAVILCSLVGGAHSSINHFTLQATHIPSPSVSARLPVVMPWDAHQGSDDAAAASPLETLAKVGDALAAGPPAPEEELTIEERIE